jgi:hypothetical protein
MSNMPGLTLADLAAMSEDVPVGDSFIAVHGISARKALAIARRFPKLLNLINGFDLATFIDAAPDAVAAIIAAGTGHFEDEQAEADAGEATIEIQFDILQAIGRLTFKNGFGPFVEKIMRLAGSVPDFANSGKAPVTKSPPQSSSSLPPDTPQP